MCPESRKRRWKSSRGALIRRKPSTDTEGEALVWENALARIDKKDALSEN